MASPKFTPGPWEFRQYGSMFPTHRGNIISVCKGFPQKWVADAVGQETADEREANARLIAAAPELYAALASVVKIAQEAHAEWDKDNDARVGKILMALAGYLKNYRPDITAIHAALAKATGDDAVREALRIGEGEK